MNRRHFITAVVVAPWAISGCVHRPLVSSKWKRLASLPNPLGVAAPFAGVSDDALLVAGGANFPNGFPWQDGRKVWHDVVYQLDSPDGKWSIASKLPRPLAYGISINTPKGLVCIGGSDATRHYPGAFRLFTKGDSLRIEPLPALPTPLANAAGALVDQRIVVCGGASEPGEISTLNKTWFLDLKKESTGWRKMEPLPAEPRFLSVAAASGDDFYLFGGVGLSSNGRTLSRVYLRDAWRNRMGHGWERLADMPRPLAAAPSPAPIIGNEIILLPGDDGSRFGFQPVEKHPGFPRRMLAYNIQTNTWREAGEAPFAHVTTPCVHWRGLHVVPSGEVRPGVRSPEVWSLNQP